MKKVLAIAGSDSSGGAGIQADIKTITMHKMYAMTTITALTAQNTMGVFGVMEVSEDLLKKQLDAVFTDIYPDSIKIGMVSSCNIIKVIVKKLKEYDAKNIILDPVMVTNGGSRLFIDEAKAILISELMPLASIITPNFWEAEILSGLSIYGEEDMVKAAKEIAKSYKGAILIKGGGRQKAIDLLYKEGDLLWLRGEKVDNPNTHGTGCTLSSAIACNLARGDSIEESVKKAKAYVQKALGSMLELGKGAGPLNHMWELE